MRCTILALALLPLPLWAEEAPPNIAPATGTEGPVARLLEAQRLNALGQEMRDPTLLLAAARLMQGVTLREVTRATAEPVAQPEAKADKPAGKKKKAEPAPEPAPPQPPQPATGPATVPDPARMAPLPGTLDPKALMEAARAMLPEGALLRDAIADLAAELPPPGPVAAVTALRQDPGGSTTFAVPLAGDSYAEIGLLRMDAGHLTLTVTDAQGHPVCVDASASPSTLCGVMPRESDRFLVTVTNDGPGVASYLLVTN